MLGPVGKSLDCRLLVIELAGQPGHLGGADPPSEELLFRVGDGLGNLGELPGVILGRDDYLLPHRHRTEFVEWARADRLALAPAAARRAFPLVVALVPVFPGQAERRRGAQAAASTRYSFCALAPSFEKRPKSMTQCVQWNKVR